MAKSDKQPTSPKPKQTEQSLAEVKVEMMTLLIDQKDSEIKYLRELVKTLISDEGDIDHAENNQTN